MSSASSSSKNVRLAPRIFFIVKQSQLCQFFFLSAVVFKDWALSRLTSNTSAAYHLACKCILLIPCLSPNVRNVGIISVSLIGSVKREKAGIHRENSFEKPPFLCCAKRRWKSLFIVSTYSTVSLSPRILCFVLRIWCFRKRLLLSNHTIINHFQLKAYTKAFLGHEKYERDVNFSPGLFLACRSQHAAPLWTLFLVACTMYITDDGAQETHNEGISRIIKKMF